MIGLLTLVTPLVAMLAALPVIAKRAWPKLQRALPVAPVAAQETPPAPPARYACERLRVLVVDERALIGEQIARMLPAHEVTRVRSAEEAMAATQAGKLDAILYALAMPGLSGFAFAELLAAQQPALRARLVFMLDHAPSSGMVGNVERTGVRWITKPLHYVPLATAVGSAAGSAAALAS